MYGGFGGGGFRGLGGTPVPRYHARDHEFVVCVVCCVLCGVVCGVICGLGFRVQGLGFMVWG